MSNESSSGVVTHLKAIKVLANELKQLTEGLIPHLNNALGIEDKKWHFSCEFSHTNNWMVAEWRMNASDLCERFVRFKVQGTSHAFATGAHSELTSALNDWLEGRPVAVKPKSNTPKKRCENA